MRQVEDCQSCGHPMFPRNGNEYGAVKFEGEKERGMVTDNSGITLITFEKGYHQKFQRN